MGCWEGSRGFCGLGMGDWGLVFYEERDSVGDLDGGEIHGRMFGTGGRVLALATWRGIISLVARVCLTELPGSLVREGDPGRRKADRVNRRTNSCTLQASLMIQQGCRNWFVGVASGGFKKQVLNGDNSFRCF